MLCYSLFSSIHFTRSKLAFHLFDFFSSSTSEVIHGDTRGGGGTKGCSTRCLERCIFDVSPFNFNY